MTFPGYRGQAARTEAVYHTPTSNFNLTVADAQVRFATLFLRLISREFLNRKASRSNCRFEIKGGKRPVTVWIRAGDSRSRRERVHDRVIQ